MENIDEYLASLREKYGDVDFEITFDYTPYAEMSQETRDNLPGTSEWKTFEPRPASPIEPPPNLSPQYPTFDYSYKDRSSEGPCQLERQQRQPSAVPSVFGNSCDYDSDAEMFVLRFAQPPTPSVNQDAMEESSDFKDVKNVLTHCAPSKRVRKQAIRIAPKWSKEKYAPRVKNSSQTLPRPSPALSLEAIADRNRKMANIMRERKILMKMNATFGRPEAEKLSPPTKRKFALPM